MFQKINNDGNFFLSSDGRLPAITRHCQMPPLISYAFLKIFENEFSGVTLPLRCATTLFTTSKPRITEHLLFGFLKTISSSDTLP